MRLSLAVLLSALLFPPALNAQSPVAEDTARPRVALVLAGGGAKGMAHIGVLQVLEEAGIPIDIVCGTSIGSLVGGMYALGYTPASMDSLVRSVDWATLLSDKEPTDELTLTDRRKSTTYCLSLPVNLGRGEKKRSIGTSGLITGHNIANLFTRLTIGYHDSIDFDTLPRPFACVAVNMVDYAEVDFHSGHLATAMRASMSIPAVFSPVRLDTMLLVDGGLQNNYPADLARQMGADYIIGVDIRGAKTYTADELESTMNMVMQLIDVNCINKYDQNLALTDIPIQVDVDPYTAASFTAAATDTLIRRGREAALAKWDDLIALRQKLHPTADEPRPRRSAMAATAKDYTVPADTIIFQDITPNDQRHLTARYKLQDKDSLPLSTIESMVSTLRTQLFYNNAAYALSDSTITLTTTGKKLSQLYLGLRYDNEEKVALALGAEHHFHTRIPLTSLLSLRLGERNLGRLDLIARPAWMSSVRLTYYFQYNEIDIYDHGDKDFNYEYRSHNVELAPLNITTNHLALALYARLSRLELTNSLTSTRQAARATDNSLTTLSYHARLAIDTQDETTFPARGHQLTLQYALHTTNGLEYKGGTPISLVSGHWAFNIPLSPRLTLRPLLYGRTYTSDNLNAIYGNAIGGPFFAHYTEGQMPFAGLQHVELAQRRLLAAQLTLQQRIATNNYILLSTAAGQTATHFSQLFKTRTLLGASLAYAYNSIIGPIAAGIGYNNRADKLSLYINVGHAF